MPRLPARMLNVLACPADVFDEIIAAPPKLANWLVPTFLVCVASLLLLGTSGDFAPSSALGPSNATQSAAIASRLRLITWLAIGTAAFAGTSWSALVLWLIGRIFLKTRFSYLKTVEIVALASMILVLGTVVTALLVTATGNPDARPALSLLGDRASAASHARAFLEACNLFHLWTATVLAIGLSRLAAVSLKESAFWVLGIWVVARLAIVLLA